MRTRNIIASAILFAGIFGALGAAGNAVAQTDRRATRVRPTPTPITEPVIISRAEDFPDENATPQRPITATPAAVDDSETRKTIEALQARIKTLEEGRQADPDARQRRLLLNLDILTRAEQRVESLRKQLFDMVEKETNVQARLQSLEMEARPEMVDRSVAFTGSLRPEELREARTKQLAAERTKLQTLLVEIQKNKSNLESNITKAEDLVERLRTKLERDIDEALKDDPPASKDQ